MIPASGDEDNSGFEWDTLLQRKRQNPGIDLGDPQAHAHIFAGGIHTHKKKKDILKNIKKHPNIQPNVKELPIDGVQYNLL